MTQKPAKPARVPKWNPAYLRAYRLWAELSVEELAARINYNSGSLNEMENGHKRYNQDVLEAIAEELDVPPAFLVGRPPPPIGEEIDKTDPLYMTWKLHGMSPENAADFVKMAPGAMKRFQSRG